MLPHSTTDGMELGVVVCTVPVAVDTDVAVAPLSPAMCCLPATVFDIAAAAWVVGIVVGAVTAVAVAGVIIVGVIGVGAAKLSVPSAAVGLSTLPVCPIQLVLSPYFCHNPSTSRSFSVQ